MGRLGSKSLKKEQIFRKWNFKIEKWKTVTTIIKFNFCLIKLKLREETERFTKWISNFERFKKEYKKRQRKFKHENINYWRRIIWIQINLARTFRTA